MQVEILQPGFKERSARRSHRVELESEIKGGTMNLLLRLWKDETGQDTAEYALLLLLIALALIVAITGFRSAIANAFSRATAQLNTTT